MKKSEIEAKIEKIKGMSGISDSAKADMIAAWEKKLKAADKPMRGPVGRREREFKIDDVVYDKKHKSIGIIRSVDADEIYTNAYGGLKHSEVEHYNRMYHGKATVENGTRSEIERRNLATLEPENQKRTRKKKSEPKPKTKSTYKFKGKNLSELSAEECAEAVQESKDRRAKAAKAERKSKRRPVMEKVTANVAKAVKQVIENIPASDLKDAPKTELKKIDRVVSAAKNFVKELKTILGDDFDKETIDDEFKEIHALAKELHTKYGE